MVPFRKRNTATRWETSELSWADPVNFMLANLLFLSFKFNSSSLYPWGPGLPLYGKDNYVWHWHIIKPRAIQSSDIHVAGFSLYRHPGPLFDGLTSQILPSYYLHLYLLFGLYNLLGRYYYEWQHLGTILPIRSKRSGRRGAVCGSVL